MRSGTRISTKYEIYGKIWDGNFVLVVQRHDIRLKNKDRLRFSYWIFFIGVIGVYEWMDVLWADMSQFGMDDNGALCA